MLYIITDELLRNRPLLLFCLVFTRCFISQLLRQLMLPIMLEEIAEGFLLPKGKNFSQHFKKLIRIFVKLVQHSKLAFREETVADFLHLCSLMNVGQTSSKILELLCVRTVKLYTFLSNFIWDDARIQLSLIYSISLSYLPWKRQIKHHQFNWVVHMPTYHCLSFLSSSGKIQQSSKDYSDYQFSERENITSLFLSPQRVRKWLKSLSQQVS